MDSWMHFLNSKYAFKYPELFLDQWNKPIFTIVTAPICQLGLNALVIFNIMCVALAGLLLALAFNYKGYKNSWLLIPLMIFTPISFLHTVSALTEPLNILMIALFIYLWLIDKRIAAVILAGFFPFVRTEGFVIGGAVVYLILWSRDYKLLLWLFVGSIMMNFVGFIITGHPFWIISDNPYWRHEMNGTFDPGSGSILHFFKQSKFMFGLPLLVLMSLATLLPLYNRINKIKNSELLVFALLGFWLYFVAHTTIYYFGILGSHGLTRPFAVVAPFTAMMVYFVWDFFLEKVKHQFRILSSIILTLLVIGFAYKETGFPNPLKYSKVAIPFDKTQINFLNAGNWLKEQKLINRVIVQQSPYFNVTFNKDPFNINNSYWIWSIDKNADWTKKGTIVIWDGFSAKREGGMPLKWLQNNTNYKQIHFIDGEEKVEGDPDRYDIYIFEKIN